jgi:hypothetical protein
MSWSTSFEAESTEDLHNKADAYAAAMLESAARQRAQDQVGIAAVMAIDLAIKLGATKCFVQINGYTEAASGAGDCIGVCVARR